MTTIIKIKCDFCGKEIECPEDMLKAEKHACFECFENLEEKLTDEEIDKIHVDVPRDKMDDIVARDLVQTLMEKVFPNLWKDAKEDLKEMSRKESSAHMFIAGAKSMFDIMSEMSKESEKDEEKK